MTTTTTLKIVTLCVICAATLMGGCIDNTEVIDTPINAKNIEINIAKVVPDNTVIVSSTPISTPISIPSSTPTPKPTIAPISTPTPKSMSEIMIFNGAAVISKYHDEPNKIVIQIQSGRKEEIHKLDSITIKLGDTQIGQLESTKINDRGHRSYPTILIILPDGITHFDGNITVTAKIIDYDGNKYPDQNIKVNVRYIPEYASYFEPGGEYITLS